MESPHSASTGISAAGPCQDSRYLHNLVDKGGVFGTIRTEMTVSSDHEQLSGRLGKVVQLVITGKHEI